MELHVLELSIEEICLRLLCAVLVGTVIGLEREYTHRPAGLRTHMIVALGAASVMITSQLLFVQYAPFGDVDPARLPAQVIAGVGFLGAGTILREGVNVKGLTTAASLWTVACLGIAAGAGYYEAALIGAGIMLVILTIFERLQLLLFRRQRRRYCFSIGCANVTAAMEAARALLEGRNAAITDVQIEKGEGAFTIALYVRFNGRRAEKKVESFTAELAARQEIQSVSASFAAL